MPRGLLRFGIVLMFIAILLPYTLPLIGLADPDFREVVSFFAQWFPFGSKLKKLAFALFDKYFNFYDTFYSFKCFFETTVTGWESIMELSRLFYIGALMSHAKAFFKKTLNLGANGFWNHLADFLILNIALIPVTLLSRLVFDLCEWIITERIEVSYQDETYMLIAACFTFGTVFSVLFRKRPFVNLLECVWKCISAMYIYMICIFIAFYDTPLSGASITHIVVFIICYFVAERLFSIAKGDT